MGFISKNNFYIFILIDTRTEGHFEAWQTIRAAIEADQGFKILIFFVLNLNGKKRAFLIY